MLVILNVLIWFIGIGVEVVDSEVGWKIFEYIFLSMYLLNIVEGIICISGLVFLFSIIGLFCFLVECVVEFVCWR